MTEDIVIQPTLVCTPGTPRVSGTPEYFEYTAEYLTRALDAYVKAMNKVEAVSPTEAGVLSCGLWSVAR